jgi:hypothetical protein
MDQQLIVLKSCLEQSQSPVELIDILCLKTDLPPRTRLFVNQLLYSRVDYERKDAS